MKSAIIKPLIRRIMQPALLLAYRLNGIRVFDSDITYPLEKKREFLKKLRTKRPDIRTFIETGTNYGDTLDFLEHDFDYLYSVELADSYAAAAKRRFAGKEKITIIHGDSAKEMDNILSNLHSPCMFWLDGHYSQGDTAKGDTETPIMQEILSCLKHGNNHLILIDDARLFIGRHDYPSMFSLKKICKGTKYSLFIKHDIIILSNEKDYPVFT